MQLPCCACTGQLPHAFPVLTNPAKLNEGSFVQQNPVALTHVSPKAAIM